jgi:DNA-directed RNA polymerase subunit RPC12/RpoP
MLDNWWTLLAFLPFFAYLLFHATRTIACPDCGARLPTVASPLRKTRRMWRAGGYLCSRCECETDMAGRKITASTAPPPFPARQWALVGLLLLVGLGLGAAGCSYAGRAAAHPPLVALPQQAPPAAPAN